MANSPKPGGRPTPRLLTVKEAFRLSPNMIRVTFAGPELEGFPEGREGANCKILLPDDDQTKEEFARQLEDGPRPVVRTYTVRHFRSDRLEMDMDFVAHGDDGPASKWAQNAKPGSFLGFMGPGFAKMESFEADWYLLAADMSAIPVVAATLEAMPADAKGIAIFEVTDPADKLDLVAPEGIEQYWLIHPDPHKSSGAQIDLIKGIEWPDGRVQTCIAGESGVIKVLRQHILKERNVAKTDAYVSGYWKIGLVEDDHQEMKRKEAEN